MESDPLITAEAESSYSPSPRTNNHNHVLIRLYTSHFLSTWNSRMFEFGAVVFLASIYPGTLFYVSVYALIRSLFAVLFSSALGSLLDRVERLKGIRHSIIWQRIPVAVSCVCLGVLLNDPPKHFSWMLFVVLVLLAGVEKLAATANTVSVERDWAIVISDALGVPRQGTFSVLSALLVISDDTDLNASMRRIDLFCKLVAPVVVSLMDGLLSTRNAIWGVLGLNLAVVLVEYFAIAQVYHSVPELNRAFEMQPGDEEEAGEREGEGESESSHTDAASDNGNDNNENERGLVLVSTITNYVKATLAPYREYILQPVAPASFALSLLYLTVLSFGPTMVTFLLHAGFSSLTVSTMRIGAVLSEISGTVFAPFLMGKIGPIRSGLWFLNWQFLTLAVAVAPFAVGSEEGSGLSTKVVAGILVAGVGASRLGLWGFDLSVQFLVQESVSPGHRARFSATEMALQSVFEMISFGSTIIFDKPEEFKYPVYLSYGAVALAAICFAAYVHRERGHLVHMSKCMGDSRSRL
ncbi:Ferroporti-1 [Aspergillus unguis]